MSSFFQEPPNLRNRFAGIQIRIKHLIRLFKSLAIDQFLRVGVHQVTTFAANDLVKLSDAFREDDLEVIRAAEIAINVSHSRGLEFTCQAPGCVKKNAGFAANNICSLPALWDITRPSSERSSAW